MGAISNFPHADIAKLQSWHAKWKKKVLFLKSAVWCKQDQAIYTQMLSVERSTLPDHHKEFLQVLQIVAICEVMTKHFRNSTFNFQVRQSASLRHLHKAFSKFRLQVQQTLDHSLTAKQFRNLQVLQTLHPSCISTKRFRNSGYKFYKV